MFCVWTCFPHKMFSFLLGLYPGVEFLDHMAITFNVLRKCQTVCYRGHTTRGCRILVEDGKHQTRCKELRKHPRTRGVASPPAAVV